MPSSSSSSSGSAWEWKAWPGGHYYDTSLNPTEVFNSSDFGYSGNVNWNVGLGGVDAIIVENGETTITNRASITVRYDVQSPSASQYDAVEIRASPGIGAIFSIKRRTVFVTSWSLKFSGNFYNNGLTDRNNLAFDSALFGTNTRTCEFLWDGGAGGATRTCGKMEATCFLYPTGIDWSARGVTFQHGPAGAGAKFRFRLQRWKIWTTVAQDKVSLFRSIFPGHNDADWAEDGNPETFDTQYPDDPNVSAAPDKAFHIDAPNFDATPAQQVGSRLDLRETAQWHNGIAWQQISVSSEGGMVFQRDRGTAERRARRHE